MLEGGVETAAGWRRSVTSMMPTPSPDVTTSVSDRRRHRALGRALGSVQPIWFQLANAGSPGRSWVTPKRSRVSRPCTKKSADRLPRSAMLNVHGHAPASRNSSIFLRRMIGVTFMRVNSKCARQVRPPLPGLQQLRRAWWAIVGCCPTSANHHHRSKEYTVSKNITSECPGFEPESRFCRQTLDLPLTGPPCLLVLAGRAFSVLFGCYRTQVLRCSSPG